MNVKDVWPHCVDEFEELSKPHAVINYRRGSCHPVSGATKNYLVARRLEIVNIDACRPQCRDLGIYRLILSARKGGDVSAVCD